MKTLIIFSALLCISLANAFSQEFPAKEIKTDVSEVTVFIDGAQVTRKKNIDVPQGISVLRFIGLSPFIDARSIRVKANKNVTVLSVNHQQNFLSKVDIPAQINSLGTKLEQINNNIKLEGTYLDIISEELAFLKDNRDIGTNLKEVSITALKEAFLFYGTNVRTLKLKEIEHNKNIENLNNQKKDIENQIRTIAGNKEYPTGEIIIKVDAKTATDLSFELSYLVNNASWFPSYDIRSKSVNDPVELVYKANVRQDTKEDWKNVKLRFSSSNPNKTGVAPKLKPYLLNYNMLPPVYNQNSGIINGKIYDATTNEELVGANVVVEGTTIGTVTNVDGSFSLTIPNSEANLSVSSIGYLTQNIPVSNNFINVALVPDVTKLEETVVVGYGTQKKTDLQALSGRLSGVQVNRSGNIKIRNYDNNAVPSQITQKQTTVDFEIKTLYTILSDNKSYSVVMEDYNIPATYQYYCVPKVDKDAFLIASMAEWEKYNLLEGEANIFFENTYIGKTLLDTRYATDTLKLSLGRDKSISVSREKNKDFTSKQLIGTKKEESREWITTIKNNKEQSISIKIIDQVPVSTQEDIEVEIQKSSGATHNSQTGELTWDFTLNPNEKKDLDLKYTVKYSKYQNLVVE